MNRAIANLLPRTDWAWTYWLEGEPELAEYALRQALHDTADLNRAYRLADDLAAVVARCDALGHGCAA